MSLAEFLELFLSITLQAGVYVCLCALLARWSPSDRVRSRFWTNCHFGLLGLVLLGSLLPHFRIGHGRELTDSRAILESVQLQSGLGNVCLVVWLTGFCFALLRMMISGLAMIRFVSRLQPLAPEQLPLAGLRLNAATLRDVRFYLSDDLTSPFCWQFQRPVMVLPTTALRFPECELQLILRHELAHLRANHPLHLFIQQLVQCIYWFHPLVSWAGRQTDLAREMMCDAAAAENPQEIASYLRVLLKVSELKQPTALAGSASLGMLFQRELSALACRAQRLVERAKQGRLPASSRRWIVTGPFLLMGLVTLFWLPVNALSSSRSNWSACPAWTAEVLHDFGVNTRDYEIYDGRLQVFDRDPGVTGSGD